MLADDLVDVALVVRGLRTAEESRAQWESIAGRLRHALDSVRKQKPARRDPGAGRRMAAKDLGQREQPGRRDEG
jgi:hypothetical protein